MSLGHDIMDWLTGHHEIYFDALKWLRTNPNKHPFASNRFATKAAAIQAVKKIYAAGANAVSVAQIYDEPWRIEEEGGPYAATLIVTVKPQYQEGVKRVILSLAPNEFNRVGPETFRVWWD
jgi:hypothetical protein